MEWIELDQLVEVKGGGTPLRRKKEYWENGEIPWVKISDIKGSRVHITEEYITKEGLDNSSAKLIEKGSIIYTIFATIGKAALLEIDATTNQAIVGLELKESNIVDKFYLLYFLQSIEGEMKKQSRGVAQNNINIGIVKQIKIPVAPINIQKQIVEVLDEAQSLIDNRKEQIKLLDDLIESIFYDMFGDPVKNDKGWEVKALGDLTSKIGSGSTPRGGKTSYKEEGISLIRSMNVYDGEFHNKGLAFIDEEQAIKLNNVEVLERDVLINITGASINRACIVPNSILPARVNQHVSILRAKKDLINSRYLVNLLISAKFKRKLYNIATSSGATREALTKGDLEKLEILTPPIQLQNQFADKVEQIESQKQLLEESLKLLEDNYDSLMQRAFKGELFN
ncbi:MAG: restriction endonuclease subunit S [Peptoniphilaceae bacterium]